jgi:hypothetical protein
MNFSAWIVIESLVFFPDRLKRGEYRNALNVMG